VVKLEEEKAVLEKVVGNWSFSTNLWLTTLFSLP